MERAPLKPFGVTPPVVAGCPSRRSVCPTTSGLELRRLRQKRSLITTTGASPDLSSSAPSTRPICDGTPSTEKIICGNQLPEDALRFGIPVILESDIERNSGLNCGNPAEQALLIPILFDGVIRDRLFRHHQTFSIRRCRQLPKDRLPFRAEQVRGQPHSESHGNNAHQREAWRLDQSPHRIPHIAALSLRYPSGTRTAMSATRRISPMAPCLLAMSPDDVLAELHHLGAVGHFEFLRKCPCQ